MKKWWQSYQSKPVRKKRNTSITKDPVALLDERLQFFTPSYNHTFSFTEVFLYIVSWSLFLTNIQIDNLLNWSAFLYTFALNFVITVATALPILMFINFRRNTFKRIGVLKASIQIILFTICISVMTIVSILSLLNSLEVLEASLYRILIEALMHAMNVTGFVLVFLLYYLRSYKDLMALRTSFERRLEEQNEHIKSRIAPHFFFNTINTLVSLIETEPHKASNLLQHVSHLFRAGFSEPSEYSFEDEIELCEHYLKTEKYRLPDKLEVNWTLPDEEMLYDMTITSMTLQSILEQTVLHIVEMILETVYIDIIVTWENHTATIIIKAKLPKNTLLVSYDMHKRINFRAQEKRLKEHFGSTSSIQSVLEEQLYKIIINYPLHDAMA